MEKQENQRRNSGFLTPNEFGDLVDSETDISCFINIDFLIRLSDLLKYCKKCSKLEDLAKKYGQSLSLEQIKSVKGIDDLKKIREKMNEKSVMYNPCSGGCYLEKMGFDFSTASDFHTIQLVSSLCETLSLFFDTRGSLEDDKALIQFQTSLLAERAEELDKMGKELEQAQASLLADEKEFFLKKSKLGRRSKFDSRRLDYEILWYQSDPKPSIAALAKKMHLSRTTVYSDLTRINKEKESLKKKDEKSSK